MTHAVRSGILALAMSLGVFCGLTCTSPAAEPGTTPATAPVFGKWDKNSTQPPPKVGDNKLPPLTTQAGDGEAEIIYRDSIAWFERAIKKTQQLVPAAEKAAEGVINGGHIYLTGSPGFVQEYFWRAGGISSAVLTEWHQEKLTKNDVLVIGYLTPREECAPRYSLATLAQEPWIFPCTVVYIGSERWPRVQRILPHLDKGGWKDRFHFLDTDTPEGESWSNVSVQQSATAATGWAFFGEMFAAVSRKGKTLATFASLCEPYGAEWAKICEKEQFFEKYAIPPIAGGRIAGDYYRICQKQLIDCLEGGEGKQFRLGAKRVVENLEAGRSCFVVVCGHIHLRGAIVPKEFSNVVLWGRDWEWSANFLREGDLLLYLGYLDYPAKTVEQALTAKAQVITMAVAEGPTNETVTHIRGYWRAWDSVIDIENYPTRLLPTSGVVQTPQWYSLMAEAVKLRGKKQ